MPSEYYNRNFRPQHFYHIFNRGAYKHKIFKDKKDYDTFIEILIYYLKFPTAKYFSYKDTVQKPYSKVRNLHVDSVRIVAYCLMPNHFHLILKPMPTADNKTNISNLMRRLMITYAMYFQSHHKHSGAIFQGRYKNVVVDSSEQLLQLSKYIHLHKTSYSSLPEYLKKTDPTDWLYPEYVLKLTKNYSSFLSSPTKENIAQKLTKLSLE